MVVLLAVVIIGMLASISVFLIDGLLFFVIFTILWTLISRTQLHSLVGRRRFLDDEKVFLFSFKILF